jgi:hypothetical protein
MKKPTTVLVELTAAEYTQLKSIAVKNDRSIRAQVRVFVSEAIRIQK